LVPASCKCRSEPATFRIFVSSTFEDLKAERDALQRKAESGEAHHEVFPKLSQNCAKSTGRSAGGQRIRRYPGVVAPVDIPSLVPTPPDFSSDEKTAARARCVPMSSFDSSPALALLFFNIAAVCLASRCQSVACRDSVGLFCKGKSLAWATVAECCESRLVRE